VLVKKMESPTCLRLRRQNLGLNGGEVARECGFTLSKFARIERKPADAFLRDVILIEGVLSRLEESARGSSYLRASEFQDRDFLERVL
jgi:predicted transcriptional regulator